MTPETGRQLWAELHAFARAFSPGPLSQADHWRAVIWLDDFNLRVVLASGQGAGCGCGNDWLRLYASNPPALTSGDDFFTWTVMMHNRVNFRLGKGYWTASSES